LPAAHCTRHKNATGKPHRLDLPVANGRCPWSLHLSPKIFQTRSILSLDGSPHLQYKSSTNFLIGHNFSFQENQEDTIHEKGVQVDPRTCGRPTVLATTNKRLFC
jgi:hypothetical protein